MGGDPQRGRVQAGLPELGQKRGGRELSGQKSRTDVPKMENSVLEGKGPKLKELVRVACRLGD